jgi:hypothetical protein
MKKGLTAVVAGLILGSLLVSVSALADPTVVSSPLGPSPSGSLVATDVDGEDPESWRGRPRPDETLARTSLGGNATDATVAGTPHRTNGRLGGESGLSATTQNSRTTRGDVPNGWNAARGEGTVGAGAVLFMGEEDIAFGGSLSGATTLFGVDGTADGDSLVVDPDNVRITDAAGFELGRYTTNGNPEGPGIVVQEARVVDVDIRNEQGFEVSGTTVPRGERLTVTVTWNYFRAEDIVLRVTRRDDGVEVTDAVLMAGNSSAVGSGTTGVGDQFQPSESSAEATWVVDTSDQEDGVYVFEFGGVDDLDDAAATTRIEVVPDGDPPTPTSTPTTTATPTPTSTPTTTATPTPTSTPTTTSTTTTTPPNGGTPIQLVAAGVVGLMIGVILGTFDSVEIKAGAIAILSALLGGQLFGLFSEYGDPGVVAAALAGGVILGIVLGTLLPSDSNDTQR